MCIFTSCIKDNGGETIMKQNGSLANLAYPLSSYSGNYEAILEEFDDNGVKSYRLYISNVNKIDPKYEVDLIFRARDRNYIFWADNDDILWSYSGDIGTFFWIKEDGYWNKKAYADNPNANVPKELKDARPNKYN